MLAVILVVLAVFIASSSATTGVDVSQAVTPGSWTCLKGQGVSFAIVRGYQSVGRLDPNARSNIANARAAGIAYVDAYIFPCVPCGNPEGQIEATVSGLSGANYGMLWLDIERQSWSSNLATNQDFIARLIAKGKAMGVHLGIYTNYNNWQTIVGIGWTGGSSLPLWYAHYDGNPNFGDFAAFGGWSKPSIKQYLGDKTACSVGVDYNWYP